MVVLVEENIDKSRVDLELLDEDDIDDLEEELQELDHDAHRHVVVVDLHGRAKFDDLVVSPCDNVKEPDKEKYFY